LNTLRLYFHADGPQISYLAPVSNILLSKTPGARDLCTPAVDTENNFELVICRQLLNVKPRSTTVIMTSVTDI